MNNSVRDIRFEVLKTVPGAKARACRFNTLHGTIESPLFMPVGTQATVRNVSAPVLQSAGSQILLANTFHLLLRPGPEVFEKFGGIHNFMKWNGSVLTDSGGYQVFSLSQIRRITEEGVEFSSYVDGTKHLLSPEHSIGTQKSIGSDIMMAMDLCIPSTADFDETKKAMEHTHRWALRSLKARGDSPQAIFGIVQGACHEELRIESAQFISSLPFDGIAIGGLAVGETKEERERFTDLVTGYLPQNKPRYLMGVGTPIDLLEAVHRGVDMFDCIIPTQLAEQGTVFTSLGRIQLARGVYKFDDSPLDPNCACPACATYSKAYLHHIVKTCEPLSTQLLGAHNIYFYHQLMKNIRESIRAGTFLSFYGEWRERLQSRDVVPTPPKPKIGKRPARRPMQMGAFEISVASENLYSIKHSASGEIMHPGPDPMNEARNLYIKQSGVLEALVHTDLSEASSNTTVVWDVGLGAGFNAMALIEAAEKLPLKGELKLISFENDLDSLRLALCHPAYFPHLRHGGPHSIVDGGHYKKGQISWELYEGDFLETYIRAPKPSFVFFDPFSFKTDSKLWALDTFSSLYRYLKDQKTLLLNYTASTVIRARLLMAGFYVGKGQASPPKSETTVAATYPLEIGLLSHEWIQRLERSDAKGLIASEKRLEDIYDQLRSHPQFQI